MRRAALTTSRVSRISGAAWALDNSRQIATATDHPPSAERFVELEAAVKEIGTKELAHEPLMPNLKKK